MDTAVTMQPTRWEILRVIKRQGKATVEDLANHLHVTPMAVRLHLVVLERDGMVSRGLLRRGPGRPALVYALTTRADDLFPKRYDLLADALLTGLRQQAGPDAVSEACRSAAGQLVSSYQHRVAGKNFEDRVAEVAAILTEMGCDAVWERRDGGFLLKEYNCPYQRVAEKHVEVCALDRQVLRTLLDADLEFTDCMAEHAVQCSCRIRPKSS